MVKERMDLLELLRKGGMDGDVDFLREALRVLVEGIMDAEVSARTGAEYGERSPERVTQRNGYRSRAWDTRVGTMELHIPKLREGSYFPSLLEPRRRSERALLAVIPAGLCGRCIDKAGGRPGQGPGVRGYLQEPGVAYLSGAGRGGGWLPGPSAGRRTISLPVAGRTNPRRSERTAGSSTSAWWWQRRSNGEGKREIIGMDVGTSADGAFWLAFLRSLSARGLSGGGSGGIGCASGTQGCHRDCLRWGQLATVPHPLHDQPAHSGPQAALSPGWPTWSAPSTSSRPLRRSTHSSSG